VLECVRRKESLNRRIARKKKNENNYKAVQSKYNTQLSSEVHDNIMCPSFRQMKHNKKNYSVVSHSDLVELGYQKKKRNPSKIRKVAPIWRTPSGTVSISLF